MLFKRCSLSHKLGLILLIGNENYSGTKLVDEKFNMEGCFNYVLFAGSEISEQTNGEIKVSKYFLTQSDGSNTAKTPAGVFNELKIPNDLGYIIDKINEYENGD